MHKPSATVLIVLAAATAAASGFQDDEPPRDTLPTPLSRDVPLGLERELAPEALPAAELIALGRRLFFDVRLSSDESVSCASCHRPDHGFADPRAHSVGVGGAETPRNAPSLLNRVLGASFTWDGRAATLEEQAAMPLDNPEEMNLPPAQAAARVALDASYVREFEAVLGAKPNAENVPLALAAFVKALTYGDTPYDRFNAGEVGALTPAERSGLWVYESRGRCWRCHSGHNFSDELFHNTGVGAVEEQPEDGRFAITKDVTDRGAFKTPTLRGLAETAPYMHDGSLATLEEVVQFYRDGGHANASLSELMEPLELTDADAANLVAFLKALSRRP